MEEKPTETARATRPNRQAYSRVCRLVLYSALLWGIACRAQGQAQPETGQLYLLAATTSQHWPEGYPATLYRVGANRKLEWLREVVSSADGTRFIYAYGDTIFLLHPHSAVTGVAMVHTDDPMRADDVTFAPQGIIPSPSATVIVEPPGSAEALLVPWITNVKDSATPPEKIEVTSALISSDSANSAKRVRFNAWREYAYLRSEGTGGGPNYVPGILTTRRDDRVAMDVFGHSTSLASLPSAMEQSSVPVVPVVVGSGDRFLVVVRQPTWEEINSGKLSSSRVLHIFDRAQRAWTATKIDANAPSVRLVEPWLAVIAGIWRPDHEPPPGRENEREMETETNGPHSVRLPPVRVLYRSYVGTTFSSRGSLFSRIWWTGGIYALRRGRKTARFCASKMMWCYIG